MRTIGARLFDYRISRTQRTLDELQKQRDETIEKLKVATKYNSTQQLLEKYGGESPKPSPSPKARAEKQKPSTPPQPPVARTGLPPPPTANIRRPPSAQPPSGPGNPPSPPPYQAPVQQQSLPHTPPPPPPPAPQPSTDEPGFAPNAFPSRGQYIEQPHWYDRLLDVLLGEDEMQPRNRMAMICSSCRLVNGQAPPGIKTPEELGRWRCGSCGAWNGVESETTKILSSLRQNAGPAEGNWESQSEAEGHPDSEGAADDGAMIGSNEEGQRTPSQDPEDVAETPDEQAEDSQAEPARRSKRGKGSKSK